MATTNIMNSTNGVVSVGGVVIAELTGAKLGNQHSPRDTTNKGSAGWGEKLEGLRTWNMSASAMYIPNGSFSTLWAAFNGRTALTVRWTSTAASDDYYEGSAYLGNLDLDSPGAEDNVVFDVTFEGTGVLTEGASS